MNEEEKNLTPEVGEAAPEVAEAYAAPEAAEAPEVVAQPAAEVAAEQPVYEQPAPEVTPAPEAAAEQPAPEAEKKIGKKPILIAVAAVVVLAIAVIIIAIATSSPLKLVTKGFENSVSALKENEAVVFADKVIKGGSIGAECDMEELMDLPVEGTLSAKVYTDTDKAALTANFEVEGDTVLDASVLADKKSVVVASDVLLGDNAYGINLSKLTEKFNNSVFGPDGDLSLGIELPESVNSIGDDASKLSKDSQKIIKSVLTELLTSVNDHAEISKEKETLSFNGTDVKVTAVEVQIDGETAAAVAVDMVEYLRSNKALKAFLYEYADKIASLAEDFDYASVDFVDTLDMLYEQLDEITDEDLEDLAENLGDMDLDLSMTFYVTKSGKELIGVEFDNDEVKATVLAGPSFKEIEEISVNLDDGYTKYRINYVVETNTKKELVAELKVREDGENILVGEFNWDKSKGDFEAELTDSWGDTYGAEGSLDVSSKAVVLVLDSVSEDSYETDLGITLTISASDKMPSMPRYTDILDMSAEDLEDMVSDLESAVYDLGDLVY
ncbi:MAG: hypothetical protein IKK00_02710 [Oscillospiraceae bacterium]|nr:hypothetical protein [Oscillospiraceae bacterium]